ncbi:hypothetical protein EDD27_3520 [Nonomuraea polychroma]|uniref:Streptomyces killer toxin-like beta/gamma crystallin domain-containing protein n=1 Tax=Nonomuraea polychroma TaxID=46176 RepID=A0A438M5X4_9ACTN|nr:beta/gamma crystallin domain-containing protein [Nonomuraea polychroma]RVX41061.1 hypothetical protein EDD27_3520 [Nonomuraea polychroma]
MNQTLKRTLQVVRKTLTAGAAVALSAATLTLITAAPAHAAVGRVPCDGQIHAWVKTKDGHNLCFRGTGVLDVAIYNIGLVSSRDRWVTVYYIRNAGGPVEGQLIPPITRPDLGFHVWPEMVTHIHMITRIAI